MPPDSDELDIVETEDGLIVLDDGRQTRCACSTRSTCPSEADAGGVVKAPMHGKVVPSSCTEGEAVEKGQRLAVVEAMKMEHALVAPRAGVVSEIAVEAGQQTPEGARLIVIGDPD